MTLDEKIRYAESQLFDSYSLKVAESYVDLRAANVRLRVLSIGSGLPIVMLHGVSLAAAVWAPLVARLSGYRAHLVELPGHGLSGPFAYRMHSVRENSVLLLDELLDALELQTALVVGHSLGGMFALWHAAERPGRISSLVAIGEPAVALPGVTVRMPLSLMTVPVLGPMTLRAPATRSVYRRLLGQGLSPAAATAAPVELLDVLRFAGRRSGNARTVASLMHAIDGFRHPRHASVMSDVELGRVRVPALFLWGSDDPFLRPDQGRSSIAKMPFGVLHEIPGGHGPWLEDPDGCARFVTQHFSASGGPPAP